jgi:endonuclease/exonuclease/phosphatase family metal-dependent hydrolase
MNASPNAPELQPLLHRLRDTWRDTSDAGYTYPADNPVKRIDYVLVTDAFRIRSARVVATLASDHRPVVADLTLDGSSSRNP